jgi:nitrogen fixation protein NifX
MRIAFTSTTGERVDEHFGRAGHFHVWEVGPDKARFVERVNAITSSEDEEDRIAARASALAGCAIVYTAQIGGPAAAKLVSRRIHPMKTSGDVAVAEVVEKLQEVLRGRPPPWLRKAMAAAEGGEAAGESCQSCQSCESIDE